VVVPYGLKRNNGGTMILRKRNGTGLMAALGAATLSLGACTDAYWIAGEATKGGTSSGSSGGATASGGAGTPTAGSGGASGQPACKPGVLGGADVCLDVGAWKQKAYSTCEEAGEVLGDYVPSDACGTDAYHFVKYTCCASAPPPPPPPSECTTKVQGDATSCKPAEVWKEYAEQDCAAAGGKLNGFSPKEDCGDGNSRSVKYTCCGSAPPPPPPPSDCTTNVQGDATSCKPPGAWEEYASEDCVAAGRKLYGFSPYEDCGFGNTRYVKYTCCGIETPPPAGK
jgi:hypothetical protein